LLLRTFQNEFPSRAVPREICMPQRTTFPSLGKRPTTCNAESSSRDSNSRKRNRNEIYRGLGVGCAGYLSRPLVLVGPSLVQCPHVACILPIFGTKRRRLKNDRQRHTIPRFVSLRWYLKSPVKNILRPTTKSRIFIPLKRRENWQSSK
jgi:hypothetical protein